MLFGLIQLNSTIRELRATVGRLRETMIADVRFVKAKNALKFDGKRHDKKEIPRKSNRKE
jgi:hypothetical protein